jgi:O-antigen ligase
MSNSVDDKLPLIPVDFRFNLGLTAWIAMFCSILIWQLASLRQGELGDSTNYYRIVLVLFATAASLAAIATNYRRLDQALSAPLLLLFGYGLAALLSSVFIPTHAFYSMWKSFEIIVDVLVITAIMSFVNAQNIARGAYGALVVLNSILIIIYLLEAIAMPSLAFQPSRGFLPLYITGVLPVMTQNALAFLSAFCAFAIICRLMHPGAAALKLAYSIMLVLALVTLILAQSRTSVIALALAIMVYLLFDRRYTLLFAVIGVSVIAALTTSINETSYQYLLRGQDAQLVSTLSGRTEGWEKAWLAFQESPFTGHGFAAFARANILGTTGMSSMHGAIFDVLVGTGLMGFVPWSVAILWTLFRLFTLNFSDHPGLESAAGRGIQAEMMGVAVLILVRASTSSGLAMHQDNFMLFLTVLAYVTTIRRVTDNADARAEIAPQSIREVRRIPSLSKA